MPDLINMIPLSEYAALVGLDPSAIRHRCLRGTMPGAVKLGRDWLIPADAPLTDHRVTSGRYRKSTDAPKE